MSWRRPRRAIRRLAALAAVVCALALLPGAASAVTLVPPKPDVFLGVSDRGTTAEFNEWAELVGKHPALLQTFHPWGNSLNAAYERWRETGTRPILHISTANDQTLAEMITPEQIALGGGDNYLLQLNDFFAERGLPAYIRPLGEPNRCLNAWSPVNCDGSQKGGEHTAGWYKQAFRRIAAIVRGGQTLEGINATLAEIGLPPLNRTKGPNPEALPAAPVSIIWSPLPGGSPRVKGNFPGNYWPGSRWVDWVEHRLLLPVSGLEGPQPLLQRQAVEGQADRDHRVGGLRSRRPALRQAADRLDREAAAGADARLLPGLRRDRQPLRARRLPADDEHAAAQDPPRQLPLDRRIQRRHAAAAAGEGKAEEAEEAEAGSDAAAGTDAGAIDTAS